MSEEKVYVVMGSMGEYSDRIEWIVKAYRNEAYARRHLELATIRAKEIAFNQSNWLKNRAAIPKPDYSNIYDPNERIAFVMWEEPKYWVDETILSSEEPTQQ